MFSIVKTQENVKGDVGVHEEIEPAPYLGRISREGAIGT